MVTEKLNFTDKNNISVYKTTTTTTPKKPKRQDKSDLGPDFIAPDGGWGWVVCFAAGFSNLSIFPPLQQYGLIYRQRMSDLGFDAKASTTIVNAGMAISSLVGIVNGAMFRRYTFRQVAIAGSLLVFVGILASAFCQTFTQFIISYSAMYGIGVGLCMASNSLAVNTYFKHRRRRATGFSWTITGLGPIIFPHVSTYLLTCCGIKGTILLYAVFTLSALLCALTLQPVLWHVRKPAATAEDADAPNADKVLSENEDLPEYECKFCQQQRRHKRGIFSSQYLFNADDKDTPGFEITEPGTPMLARANDNWFGSKQSLASERYRQRLNKQMGIEDQTTKTEDCNKLLLPNYFNREREANDRYASKLSNCSKLAMEDYQCTCSEEKTLMDKVNEKERKLQKQRLQAELDAELEAEEEAKSKMSFKQKVVKFFDLDLLKDLTFVNLAFGMTIMMFGEMNFSVLTPFILNSYGYSNEKISLAMSMSGGIDIMVRFIAPLCLERVKLNNRILFSFGIFAISVGRFIVTKTNSFNTVLMVFALIGFGKGFRTIFAPLILPSYVPLKRLPAASGMQLIFHTVFSMILGPLLGLITDATNYTVTIHCLNSLTWLALFLWFSESMVRQMLTKKSVPVSE